MDWAARGKRSGQPSGEKCLACTLIVRRAFPLKSWQEVVLEKQTSSEVALQVRTAIALFHGEKNIADCFLRESFASRTSTGYVVERAWRLLQTKDLEKQHGVTAQELDMEVETLIDDQGVKISGVLLEDDEEGKGIRVRSFHAVQGLLSQHHQHDEDQLRAGQASDFAAAYLQDCRAQVWPRTFSAKPSHPALKYTQLASAVATVKEKQRLEAEEQSHQSQMLPPDLVKAAKEAQAAEEPDDVVEEAEQVGFRASLSSQLMSAKKPGKKRKADGEEKAKPPRMWRQATERAAKVPRPVPVASAATAPTSVAGSAKGPASIAGSAQSKTKKNARQRHEEKSREWRATIDIRGILEGDAGKRVLWQCEQTLLALEKVDPGNAEATHLRTFHTLDRQQRHASMTG